MKKIKKETRDQQTALKVLTFFLNDELIAMPISYIKEVNRLAGYKVVQKAPHYVLGVTNYRGRTTPILNLKKLLLLEPTNLSESPMWIAVKNGHLFMCFVVDKLHKFMEFDADSLDKTPPAADDYNTKYIRCLARDNENLIPVLAPKHITSDGHHKALRRMIEEKIDLDRQDI